MNEKEKKECCGDARCKKQAKEPVQVGTNLTMKATANLQKELEDDLEKPDKPIGSVLGEEFELDDPSEI